MESMSAEALFDYLNIKYEEEYADNPALVEAVRQVIGQLKPGSNALYKQVAGSFSKADMVRYEPSQLYDAVFIVFSYMQLSLQDLHTAMLKYAACLRVGGFLVMAAVPSDNYVQDDSRYDETGSYIIDFPTPFMGMQITTTLFTSTGLLNFLRSIGLEILGSKLALLQPKTSGSIPEDQFFIIARRIDEQHPLMGPYPVPETRPPRGTLNAEAWPPFVETLKRHDLDAVLKVLQSNKRVIDIGSGHGELPVSIARRVGECYAVEPNGARSHVLVENGHMFNVNVLKGTAEHLPLADKTCDAAVAMWILDYVDDLEASLKEMVRIVDPAAPNARIIVVQGAPDCEAINLVSKACTPYLTSDPMDKSTQLHQGYFLQIAVKVFAAHGFGDISLERVDVSCRFREPGLQSRCQHAAVVLANLYFMEHPKIEDMKGSLAKRLEKHFKKKPFEIGDAGVMLVAKPSS